jgi:hypothetical protein
MTMRSVFVVVLATVAASSSYGHTLQATQLRSCVGQEYLQMKPTTLAQRHVASAAPTCLAQGLTTVCRQKLDDNPEGDTSEITVSTPNATLARWREQGDPAYINNLLALTSSKRSPDVLIIASLQTESQGMGVQEWSVNVLTTAPDGGPTSRKTLTTTEFGAMGSLVKPKLRTTEPCRLLTTRWEERETKQGKRLVLVGELADILTDQAFSSQSNSFARRFDHKLEKMRQSNRLDRPMVFFQK